MEPITAGSSTYLLLGFSSGVIAGFNYSKYISDSTTQTSTISIISPLFTISSLQMSSNIY